MKIKYLFVASIFLSLVLIGGPAIYGASKPPEEISVQEAAKLIKKDPKNIVILDVRTPTEFNEGHIPNAQNMDFFGGNFERQIQTLPKNKEILLYCRSGKRSAGAAGILTEEGFKNVLHMHEGIESWQRAGFPVEKNKNEEVQ